MLKGQHIKKLTMIIAVLLLFIIAFLYVLKSNINVLAEEFVALDENTLLTDEIDDSNEIDYTPIYTIDDLYAINDNMSGNYILMNDIDMSEDVVTGGKYNIYGDGWRPIGSDQYYKTETVFTGVLDGNGHTIRGMRIEISSWKAETSTQGSLYIGLFSRNKGTIQNLTISDGTISNSTPPTCHIEVGGICGSNEGTIVNCHNEYVNINLKLYTSAYIKTSNASKSSFYLTSYIGGITGENWGNISNCSNVADITISMSTGADKSYSQGQNMIGGIAGYNYLATIDKSYNMGTIYGSSTAGGPDICGIAYGGTITNCYNIGSLVSGNKLCYGIGGDTNKNCYVMNIGSYVKYNFGYYNSASLTNCYYQGSSITDSHGTQLSEEQMKDDNNFSGFDFNDVWFISSDSHYPYPQLKSNTHDTSQYEHSYDEGTIIQIPTSMTTGILRHKCTLCEMTYDEVLPIMSFTISGVNVDLDDSINLNFYVEVPEKDYLFTAYLNQYDEETSVKLSSAIVQTIDGTQIYKIAYKLNAAEINDEIVLTIANKNGDLYSLVGNDGSEYGNEFDISVSNYLGALIKENQDENEVALAEALMDYGNSAQRYFNYNIDTAGDISQDIDMVSINQSDSYEYSISGDLTDYLGTSLVLESKVTVRHYFYLNDYNSDSYSIYVNDSETEIHNSYGNIYYVDVADIGPTELSKYFEIKITENDELKMKISYSTYTFIYEVLKGNSNQKLITLVKALYRYSQIADTYNTAVSD